MAFRGIISSARPFGSPLLAHARSKARWREAESPSRFGSLFAHDLRANAFRICREGKSLHTFPDHALAPCRDRRDAIEHFPDPQPRTLGGPVRQRSSLEETTSHDFVVGFGEPVLRELPDDKDGNMVAARHMTVEKYAMQLWLAGKHDASLLNQLAPQRIGKAFADLDASAGQMPAGDIAVLDQEHPVVGVQHHAANAERHAAGKTPIEVKQAPQRGLQALSQGLLVHLDPNSIRLILARGRRACQ